MGKDKVKHDKERRVTLALMLMIVLIVAILVLYYQPSPPPAKPLEIVVKNETSQDISVSVSIGGKIMFERVLGTSFSQQAYVYRAYGYSNTTIATTSSLSDAIYVVNEYVHDGQTVWLHYYPGGEVTYQVI